MSVRKLSLGVGVVVLDKGATIVTQLLALPVLAHAWGLNLFSVWVMISTVPMLMKLGDFGILTASWSRITMFVSRGEIDQARGVVHTTWVAMTVICAILLGAAAAVLYWLPPGVVPVAEGFDEAQSRSTMMVLFLLGAVGMIFWIHILVIRATGGFAFGVACGTVTNLVENLALIAAVWLGADPLEAALVMLALRCVFLAAMFILSSRRMPEVQPGFRAASRSEWKDLWPPSVDALTLNLGFLFFLQASVIALGAVTGGAVVAVFVAVRTLSRVGVQASMLISQPVSQEFGHEMARENLYRAGRYFGLVAATSLATALAIALGLLLVGKPFVWIWSGQLIDPPFQLIAFMAVSSFAAAMWNPISNLLIAVNRQKEIAYISLGVGLVGLLLIALTGHALGPVAGGMAFALVDGAMLCGCVLFLWRHWLRDPQFTSGMIASLAELRSPMASLRNRLGRGGGG